MITFDQQMQMTAESAKGIVASLSHKPADVRALHFKEMSRLGCISKGAEIVFVNAVVSAMIEQE